MGNRHALLCIDAGNTLVKWCVHRDVLNPLSTQAEVWRKPTSEFKFSGEYSACLTEFFARVVDQENLHIDAVLLSSVLGREFDESIRIECHARKIQLHVLEVNTHSYIDSLYDEPALLGKDRWAACLAVARETSASANLVVSFGTATTADALVKTDAGLWQHSGGFIAPGIQTMLNSLHESTKLPELKFAAPTPSALFDWPRNTSQAMMAGVARMQLAWVHSLVGELQHKHEQISEVWFCGGFALQLQALYPTAHWLEHAVLKGLVVDYHLQQGGLA